MARLFEPDPRYHGIARRFPGKIIAQGQPGKLAHLEQGLEDRLVLVLLDHDRRRLLQEADPVRDAGSAGHPAADLFAADAVDQAARTGEAGGCQFPEPDTLDVHDRSRT